MTETKQFQMEVMAIRQAIEGRDMTTPTEAQIEAFREAMPIWWQRGAAQKKEETEDIIKCLTAAAGVRGKMDYSPGTPIGGAAGVEEPEPKYVSTDLAAIGTMAAINATIERCAQVADEIMQTYEDELTGPQRRRVGATIRA
jgi:hypothetical protein